METFDKIRDYYAQFDEWGRLDSPSGILEQAEVLKIVSDYVPKDANILDVGAGPGRYAIEFAKRGYRLGKFGFRTISGGSLPEAKIGRRFPDLVMQWKMSISKWKTAIQL